MFKVEGSLKDLTPKERFCKRLELEKPILEAFWCWLESLNVLKGSALGKAVTYAMNQRPFIENYLLDGRCAISNNAAENAILIIYFCTCLIQTGRIIRKNWMI